MNALTRQNTAAESQQSCDMWLLLPELLSLLNAQISVNNSNESCNAGHMLFVNAFAVKATTGGLGIQRHNVFRLHLFFVYFVTV